MSSEEESSLKKRIGLKTPESTSEQSIFDFRTRLGDPQKYYNPGMEDTVKELTNPAAAKVDCLIIEIINKAENLLSLTIWARSYAHCKGHPR